jgi:hypothetical protein
MDAVVAIAADLTAWLRLLALTGAMVVGEPKAPAVPDGARPGRLSRGGRRRGGARQQLGERLVTSGGSWLADPAFCSPGEVLNIIIILAEHVVAIPAQLVSPSVAARDTQENFRPSKRRGWHDDLVIRRRPQSR